MKNLLVVLVLGMALLGCVAQSAQTTAPNTSVPAQPSAPSMQGNGSHPMGPMNMTGTKFSDWRYYPMANQIAPGPISAQAQAAMNIFTVKQTNQSDGSLSVVVTDSQDATTSKFTVMPGETLYFADGNPADDVPNEDSALVDDHFVLVDSNGSIVQMISTP